MAEAIIDHTFMIKQRKFTISIGQLKNEDTEYIQLNEILAIETKASNHFAMTNSSFQKPEALVFATRTKNDPDIQISMHYEGLPIEIMTYFISFVQEKWLN